MGDRTNPIKFGPEWLRNLPGAGAGAGGGAGGGVGAGGGGGGTRPSSHGTTSSKVLLAKLRYGREEMLALYDREAVEPPEQLKLIDVLYQPRGKPPYALNNTFEDDTSCTGRVGGTTIGSPGGIVGGGTTGLARGRGVAAADVRGTRPMPGDRTRSRPIFRQTSVGRAAPWQQRGYEEEPRLWSNGGGGGVGVGSRTNGADPPDWPPKLGTYRNKRTANTNWRQQAGGREDMPPADEWRSPENAGSRRPDKWPSTPGGDREWTHSTRRTWAAADSVDDALPEWALGENTEACAGTFDSSGAFHGYSNDDSDLPKSQESPYPLTRSHTHGAFSRSRQVDEGSDEWWASEKAKKLSPKRFMMEAGEGKGTGTNAGAGGEAWQPSSPAVDRDSPPDTRVQTEPRADRGDFKSVMLPTNNALRQKHQSIGSPTDTPTRRPVPPPHATPAPTPVVDPPPAVAAPAQPRAPLLIHHHQLHSDEETLKEKETNKLVEEILDMNLEDELRPTGRGGTATNDVLAAMFGSRFGPGPTVPVVEPDLTDRWYYEDPNRTIQGPFSSKEMYGWYKAGFFGPTLMVRRACDPTMRPLAAYGHMPFGPFEPFPTYELRRDPLLPTTPHLPLDVESLWSGGGVSGGGVSGASELMWLQRGGPAAAPLPAPLPTPLSGPLPTPLSVPTSSSDARLPQLPLYFWEHQSAISSNALLPEEIAKEMKTEEQILAQLRAAQSTIPGPVPSVAANETIAPPLPPVPAPLPAPPPAPTPAPAPVTLPVPAPLPLPLTELPPLPLPLTELPPPSPPPTTEQKARPHTKPTKQPPKEVDKPTKTKDNANAKTKNKKSKDEKKEESEPKEDDRDPIEDRDRLSNNENTPRNDEKLSKKDIEREKKEWIKEGFTVVKSGERSKRRGEETRPPAAATVTAVPTTDEPEHRDRGDRKRKEEEKSSQVEDDKKKRQAETAKKQQQMTSGSSGTTTTTTTTTGTTRRLAWSAAAGGGAPAAVPTLADIQRLERESRQAAREQAPPAPAPPLPAPPSQPAPAPWAATVETAPNNALPPHHRPAAADTHDGGFWEGPSGRNAGGGASVGASRSDAGEFEAWCVAALAGWRDLELDGPTFVAFLKDVESPFEVKEYVKCYLGESREASEFARNFLERRRRGVGGSGGAGAGARPPPAPADDLCAPAAAVTPPYEPRAGAARNQRKHKKNRMLKVDARILGFSVTAAEDRINVGDIDSV